MKIVFKVSYIFRVPMVYDAGPTTYPTLGAKLILDGAKISQLDHELIADDSVPDQEIAEISNQQLSILWDVIIYLSAYPARDTDRSVRRLGTVTSPSPLSTNFRTHTGQSALVHSVRLPNETRLLSASGRLHVWLRLASDARPPATPVDAIRNYYMIWEDMHRRNPTPGTPEEELKFARHFVSHGEPLNSTPLLNFLGREIRPGTRQYDPSDPTHQTFVKRHRELARQLVESEINSHL